MRVLDRYLIRELLIPILICTTTLVFLVLMADLFDNLDSLLKNRTPLWFIFRYYLMLTPFALTQTLPWAALLATVFLLVSLNFHNEIIAMKAAGLEAITIIRPVVFLGFLIGILSFFVADYVVPKTFRSALEIREVYIEKKREKSEGKVYSNVTYYSGGNQLHYYRSFNYGQKQIEDGIVLWLDPTTRRTRRKMVAKKGVWGNEEEGWVFENVTEYEMDLQGRILGEPRNFPTRSYSDIHITAEDLRYASGESSFLSAQELKRYIQKLEENGIQPYNEKVEYQYRLAAPWHSLILMMMAIPLLSPTRSKRIIALNVLICLCLVFSFHVLGAVALALGKAGKFPPFLGAWLNSFLYSAGAIFFLERANE